MRNLDFSSWQNLLSTLFAIALVTLIGVGIRLLVMFTIQQRRERTNRQINERLKVLIAAYKTLGGSFTGDLTVDPTHLRNPRGEPLDRNVSSQPERNGTNTDRSRRMRDAVEAALSDIILLGTEEHVRLAMSAAQELVAGRNVHTHDLVIALRNFIRKALDLAPIPADLEIPRQGPTRIASAGGKGVVVGKDSERRNAGDRQDAQSSGIGIGLGSVGFGMGGQSPEAHESKVDS